MLTVVIDGGCAICSRLGWTLNRRCAPSAVRILASQSVEGAALLAAHGLPSNPDTVVVVTPGGTILLRSAAALALLAAAGWPRTARLLGRLPLAWLDRIYVLIARHRHWLAGGATYCETRVSSQK